MIQKNPFLKYVMKDKKEDVFHSSAYAKAQNGEGIGVASTQGYQARVDLTQNRTKVRGYGESEIMTGAKANGPRAKTYTPPEKDMGSGASVARGAGVASAGGATTSATNAGAATNRAMISAKKPSVPIKKMI